MYTILSVLRNFTFTLRTQPKRIELKVFQTNFRFIKETLLKFYRKLKVSVTNKVTPFNNFVFETYYLRRFFDLIRFYPHFLKAVSLFTIVCFVNGRCYDIIIYHSKSILIIGVCNLPLWRWLLYYLCQTSYNLKLHNNHT